MSDLVLKLRTTSGQLTLSADVDLLIRSGVCTPTNAEYVLDFIGAYIHLLEDSPVLHTSGPKPRVLFRSFFNELTGNPIQGVVKKYSNLFDTLVANCYLSGGDESITGPFLEEFKDTPVFREYHLFWKTGDPVILRYLLTFLRFGKKMNYQDEDFNAAAFRDWRVVEDQVACLDFSENVMISSIADIVTYLLGPLKQTTPYPHFGPGAVSDKGIRGVRKKAEHLLYHPRLDKIFSNTIMRKAESPVENPLTPMDMVPDATKWTSSYASIDYSELRFVPKDVTKARSICMEPNSFMYFQMVVHDWMRESFRSGPLRDFIFLEDQGRNQDAAIHGSTYGSVDTIDLSAASDRVSADLVRRIFPREYLYFLLGTRTSTVRTPDGALTKVAKFAPMGSAVCFPVQCTIFASVIVYSMLLKHTNTAIGKSLDKAFTTPQYLKKFLRTQVQRGYSPNSPYQRKFEQFLVYGDDLVCDYRVTDYVTYILHSLGFVVNESKSFTGCMAFRESCGIYAFNGVDVTPYTHKVKHYREALTPTAYASLTDAVNNSGDKGYRNLQRFYLHTLLWTPLSRGDSRRRSDSRSQRKNFVLFVEDRAQFGVFVKKAKNDHLPKRYNADLQRDEIRSVRVQKKRVADKGLSWAHERYLYLMDMRTRRSVSLSTEMFGADRLRPEETGFVWGWTPSE